MNIVKEKEFDLTAFLWICLSCNLVLQLDNDRSFTESYKKTVGVFIIINFVLVPFNALISFLDVKLGRYFVKLRTGKEE